MRLIALAALIAFLAGCAGGTRSHPPAAEPPRQPSPGGTHLQGPPPAWVETARGARWLGYSSFCWQATCADYAQPRCGDERHTPTLRLRARELVRFHLGFSPSELALTFFRRGRPLQPRQLTPRSTASWRVDGGRVFTLFARVRGGADASYVACVRLTPITLSSGDQVVFPAGSVSAGDEVECVSHGTRATAAIPPPGRAGAQVADGPKGSATLDLEARSDGSVAASCK